MVFDDEFSTVKLMREGTIITNWTDLVQLISQSGAPDNIDLKDTWFNTDIEEDTRKTLSHKLSVTPENKNKTLTLSQYKPHVREIQAREGASEVNKHPAPEVVQNTSNVLKVFSLKNHPKLPVGCHILMEKRE